MSQGLRWPASLFSARLAVDAKPARKLAKSTSYGLGVGYFAVLCIIKLLAPVRGWSVTDARTAHFPVINYFIEHGFDLDYPPRLAMLPGMHVFFAAIARLFGLGPLDYTGWVAFAIQTTWGIAFLAALLGVWSAASARTRGNVIFLVPLFCSSYPLYSWLWPSTDLGAYACYLAMLLLFFRTDVLSLRFAVLFSLLTLAVSLLRQNYAILAATPAAYVVLTLSTGLLKGQRAPWRALLVNAWKLALPLAVALGVILFMLAIWGGFVPPQMAKHGSHGGIQLFPIVHAFALTGIVCVPFVLPFARQQWANGFLWQSILISIALALACILLVPMNYDPDAGRYFSVNWALTAKLGPLAGPATVGLLTAIGFFIWIGALANTIRARIAYPEMIMFGLFLLSFLAQGVAWQRYMEFLIILTLSIQLIRIGMPYRLDRLAMLGWFGAYGLLTLAKPFLP